MVLHCSFVGSELSGFPTVANKNRVLKIRWSVSLEFAWPERSWNSRVRCHGFPPLVFCIDEYDQKGLTGLFCFHQMDHPSSCSGPLAHVLHQWRRVEGRHTANVKRTAWTPVLQSSGCGLKLSREAALGRCALFLYVAAFPSTSLRWLKGRLLISFSCVLQSRLAFVVIVWKTQNICEHFWEPVFMFYLMNDAAPWTKS